MNSITVTGFVHVKPTESYEGAKGFKYYVLPYDGGDVSCWGVCVGPISVEYALPEGYSVQDECVRQAVAELKRNKDDALKAYRDTCARIDERLAKLQAIGNEVAA